MHYNMKDPFSFVGTGMVCKAHALCWWAFAGPHKLINYPVYAGTIDCMTMTFYHILTVSFPSPLWYAWLHMIAYAHMHVTPPPRALTNTNPQTTSG